MRKPTAAMPDDPEPCWRTALAGCGCWWPACLPAPRAARRVAGAVALAALVWCSLAPAVFAGQVPRWSVAWLPALGLDLGLRLDGLAWLFALLITGIGALVVLYAAWYLDPRDPARRFFTFLLLFMGAMLGVVLADNLILLVLFWELTSLSSFLLIGYWHARADARQGARMALTITGAGGLCLLAGVLLIGHIVGSFKLDVVLASGDLIRAHALYDRGAGAGAAGRLHQERAVPVSLLAAPCDGGTHAGVGLPALGHDGQVRRLPAGPPVPGAGWQRALVLDRQQRRAARPCCSAPMRRSSSTT
jgi:hypothetical protein